MRRSIHHRYRNRKTRKEFRNRPIPGHRDYGDGLDEGKYFHCSNCGFVCDIDRDALGGPESRSGATYAQAEKVYSEDAPPFYSGIDGQNKTTPLVPLLKLRSAQIVMKALADGTEATIRRTWYNDGGTGCPFCHSLNWDGRQR